MAAANERLSKQRGGVGMKERSIPVGGASLLFLFITLSLAVFAALSLSSSYADLKLNERLSASIQSYYDADAQAQEILAQIDSALQQKEPLQAAINTPWQIDGNIIAFQVDMDENHVLAVELQRTANQKNYTITRYQMLRKQQEEYPDKTYELWDGESL